MCMVPKTVEANLPSSCLSVIANSGQANVLLRLILSPYYPQCTGREVEEFFQEVCHLQE